MAEDGRIKLFMCGDVMCGRGIDQVLPHPSEPTLHESYVKDARLYVRLAEEASGTIPRPVGFDYVWGDALAELNRARPDVRLINLECAVTTSGEWWPDKEVHYRMHPRNVPVLGAAGIQCCSLANNHVLDWGHAGLNQTLETLKAAGLRGAGAGRNLAEAASPAAVEVAGKGRVLVFGLGSESSGIPWEWGATAGGPGVWLLEDLSAGTAEAVGEAMRRRRAPGEVVVASIHWGPNWGWSVSGEQRRFAHRLIETGGADVIHGHSSHHVKGLEVYRRRLIIYGCGDFIDDYEGIAGYEEFRPDLGLMFFVSLEAGGGLAAVELVPTQIRRFQVRRAAADGAAWLHEVLNREGERFTTTVELGPERRLVLRWD